MTMREPERTLRSRMADALRRRAHPISAEWVNVISERLDIDRREVLPSESLLVHVPVCLLAIADSLERPEGAFPLDLIREHMGELVHLRRGQGFGVEELLAEFEVLASLLQDFIEQAVADRDFAVDPTDLAAVVGDLKEAFAAFGLETARSFRIWEASEKRERAMRTTTFAAMLRHELRNQLGSAQTAAELLGEDGVDAERQQRLVGLILRGVEQALATVDIVRAIITEDGDSSGEPPWLPLADILHGIAGGIRSSPSGIGLEVRGAPDVLVPGSRVSTILLNLVDNALRYHDERKKVRWVRMYAETLARDGDETRSVRITVADNGRGIDPAIQESVFDFAVRGDDPGGGSGLGLALSRDIVHELGGHIQIESEPGEGTRISFVVPARRPPSDRR